MITIEGNNNNKPVAECIKNKKYNILLVSNMNTTPNRLGKKSKKENLYDTLKNSNLFSKIKIVSLEAVNDFKELMLSIYDCVIYDLLDGSDPKMKNPEKEIENYVRNGGNIIVTHDHIHKGLLDILGIKVIKEGNHYEKVKIVNFEHKIWNSYYDLNDWKSKQPINISKTHGKLKLKESNNKTQRLMVSYDNYDLLYLSTRKIGMGNAIFWNAGHSPDITLEEKQLFINIVIWALRNN